LEEQEHVPFTVMGTNTATKLIQIARIAKERKIEKFTSLTHLLNADYLYGCFMEVKKRKAAGIDGRTIESYSEQEIKEILGLTAIHIQQKKYRPKPVRSVEIAKENGKTRTLGIPTVVDKVVQLAITKILLAIYDSSFLEVSYGYRPGKGAHESLKVVNHMIMQKKVNWIVDADISGFFDNIDHTWMLKFLGHRIADPNFKRLIFRFLKAGIMRENIHQESTKGTPQGGIISPVLANIYLHYVLDLWFEKVEKKKVYGYSELVRYADDFIIGVQHELETKRILAALTERLKKFGLTLSEEKTRIREFGRFAEENQRKKGKQKPETFDFLGFTHYCTATQDGRFMVQVRTSKKKMKKSLRAMHAFLKVARVQKHPKDIWPLLKQKLEGHYNYYGVSGNIEGLKHYYKKTKSYVFYWFRRKSQRRRWNWEEFLRYESRYPLAEPKLTYAIYHTW
jgi:group II intron reverse transcriptase/maturase